MSASTWTATGAGGATDVAGGVLPGGSTKTDNMLKRHRTPERKPGSGYSPGRVEV